jgi:hypothetical protein
MKAILVSVRFFWTDGPRRRYSVGHWDGDTLVVETTGFRDDVWLDVNGSPMTNAGKLIEKFRRPNFGNLEIEVTVDDPKHIRSHLRSRCINGLWRIPT